MQSQKSEEVKAWLSEDPGRPNYVSTLSSNQKFLMDPWRVKNPEHFLSSLKESLEGRSGVEILDVGLDYIKATFKSRIFGFVDDVWFLIIEGRVHFKSASRIGYGDLGTNKRRMLRLQKELKKELLNE